MQSLKQNEGLKQASHPVCTRLHTTESFTINYTSKSNASH